MGLRRSGVLGRAREAKDFVACLRTRVRVYLIIG